MDNWKNLIRKDWKSKAGQGEADIGNEMFAEYEDFSQGYDEQEDSTYEMHDKTEQSYEQIRELFEEAIKIANGITNRTKKQVDLVRFLESILTEGYYETYREANK